MINGLGVLGYGVGGIEAEAVLLGQPLYQPMPRIVGVRLVGELPRGSTATDLVLVVTEMLRAYGVVGAFVEFSGDGLASSRWPIGPRSQHEPRVRGDRDDVPDRRRDARLPAHDARPAELVDLVERYAKEQGLWRLPGAEPQFDALLELDLGDGRSVGRGATATAGPRAADGAQGNFRSNYPDGLTDVPPHPAGRALRGRGRRHRRALAAARPGHGGNRAPGARADRAGAGGSAAAGGPHPQEYASVTIEVGGQRVDVRSGSVAIAAITSCTNTSNPTVMVGAGLLARNAIARGLRVGPTVKTSLAPGSRAVTTYLASAGLMEPLETLGFALAGYGCTTCIGNSGPLDEPVARAVEEHDLVVAAVLSGNRNFEGRIHPAGPGVLPRLAAPRRRVRARRPGGHRPHEGAAGHAIATGSP